MKSDFQIQVARHRESPDGYLELQEVAHEFLARTPYSDWSLDEVVDFLYVCEIDDDEVIFDALGDFWERPDSPEFKASRQRLLGLATHSLNLESGDSRWQLARQLGRATCCDTAVEQLLIQFVADPEEYVRRMALDSLAHIHSPQAEECALRLWSREDRMQEYSQMMVLSVLQEIGSGRYEEFLGMAASSEYQHLGRFARHQRPPVTSIPLMTAAPGELFGAELKCTARTSDKAFILIPRELILEEGLRLVKVDFRLTIFHCDYRVSSSWYEPKYEVLMHSVRLDLGEINYFCGRLRRWLDLPLRQIATTPFHGHFYLGHASDQLNLKFGPDRHNAQKTDWLGLELAYGNPRGRGQETFELDRSCLQCFLENWEQLR